MKTWIFVIKKSGFIFALFGFEPVNKETLCLNFSYNFEHLEVIRIVYFQIIDKLNKSKIWQPSEYLLFFYTYYGCLDAAYCKIILKSATQGLYKFSG